MNISVVIPTFNRKHLLKRAIESVLNQSIKPYDIIVVDDGSTDDTSEMIQQKYKSINLIQQKNSGVSAARNNGIKNAQGDWIALLDSDDEWEENKLEEQVNNLTDNPKYEFCHTNEIWIRNGIRVNQKKRHKKYGGFIFDKCLDICRISPSSVLFNKNILNHVGWFDEKLPVCEDYDLWLRICSKYPVLFVDEPLIVKYGGHDDQLSRKHWGMDRFRAKALEKMIASGASNDEDEKATVNMILQKCGIIINGMKKRGKDVEAMEWEEKLKKYKK